jgi:hypothetical protein
LLGLLAESSGPSIFQAMTSSVYTIEVTFTVALMIHDYSRFLLHGSIFSVPA